MITLKEKTPSKIIELELEIKLLDYLKEEKVIEESMYNFIINRIINKINLERNLINTASRNNPKNYKLIT